MQFSELNIASLLSPELRGYLFNPFLFLLKYMIFSFFNCTLTENVFVKCILNSFQKVTFVCEMLGRVSSTFQEKNMKYTLNH